MTIRSSNKIDNNILGLIWYLRVYNYALDKRKSVDNPTDVFYNVSLLHNSKLSTGLIRLSYVVCQNLHEVISLQRSLAMNNPTIIYNTVYPIDLIIPVMKTWLSVIENGVLS